MDKRKMIYHLKKIKESIMRGAGGGVTCVAWMHGSCNETICERIDWMLLELGENQEQLEIENDAFAKGGQK